MVSAIDFVYRLRPEHLQSFWYFASKINLAIIGSFGCLLWATGDGKEEMEFYRSKLSEYKWTLRVSSKGAEFMGFAMEIIDASIALLTEQQTKSSRPRETTEEAVEVQSQNLRNQYVRTEGAQPIQNYNTMSTMATYSDIGEEYDPRLDFEGLMDQGIHQTSPSATISADLSAEEPDAPFYSPDGAIYNTEDPPHEGFDFLPRQGQGMAPVMWMGNGLVDESWRG